MKKMGFLGGPPPPPPPPSSVIPLPPQESQLYSPTQYSGVYSPSRATSPHSDDEVVDLARAKKSSGRPPPPSEPTLARPGKVLGSDQAKRRLQAFASVNKRCRTTQGPKGKVAQAFQEDEEAEAKERESEMKRKLAVASSMKETLPGSISSSTPVMASIMKEETENRELVKRSMETLARKNEEEEERKKEKMSSTGDHRRIPFEEQEDLRDVLMKKREDKEKESGRGRPEKDKRSRSRSVKRERRSKSPRKKSRSKSWRKRSSSRSPVKRSWSRNARKSSRSRRRSLSRSRSQERSRDRSRGGRGGAERRSRSMSSTSTRRRSNSTKRSRSRQLSSRRRSRSREKGASKIKEESRSPQKKGADRSNSRRGRIERRLEPSEERDARRGRFGRRRRRESSSAKGSRRSGSRRRSLSSDGMRGIDVKSESRKRSNSPGRRRGGRSADRNSSRRPKSMSRGRSMSHVMEARDISFEEDRQNRGDSDENGRYKESPGGERRSSPRAENWGSGDSRVTSTSKVKERVASGEEEVVMVKVASEEDYFAVKQEARPPLNDTAGLVEGNFIPVPVKYIKITSCGGVKWSMNRVTSEASDPVFQRSLEIRKSVESAVLDLEQEVIRKKSRERSSDYKEEKSESSGSKKKKKKKQKSVKNSKKERGSSKKKQRLDKSSSSSSSSKKKKKKKVSKEKDADISSEIQHESPELKARHRSGSLGSPSNAPKPNSNASKLFSMAGYADDNQHQEPQMSISRSSNQSLSPSPLKASKSHTEASAKLNEYGWGERGPADVPRNKSPTEEKAGRGRPTSRNSGRHSVSPVPNGPEVREASGRDMADQTSERSRADQDRFRRGEFSPMTHMPPEDACWGAEGGSSPPRSRSPSPSLLADLSRISSGPRSPSPGPRLPKFKDSRSPSKVPIMRDRRSPIREDGGSGSKRSSPRKKEKTRKSRKAQDSPRGFHDSPRYHQDMLYPADPEQEGCRYKNGRRDDDQEGGRYPSPSRGPYSPPPEGKTKYSPMQSTSLSPSPAAKAHPRPSSRPTTPPGSPYRRAASPVHKEISGSFLSPRGPRSPYSPRRQRSPALSPQRPFSPNDRQASYSSSRTRSPLRGARSPERRGPYSSQSRAYSPRSPGRRHSRSPQGRRQAPRSPDNRRPPSPRGRRQRSPDRRPGSPRGFSPRGRSPYRNDRSPRRGYYSPSMGRGGTRRPYTPPLSPRGPRSPERRRYSPDRRYSPGRRRYSPDREMRNLPDSTISDAELARQMPPPPHRHLGRLPGLNSPLLGQYGASPKRLSLDERLEREHGIKVEPEPPMNLHGPPMGHHGTPLDFSRPPPGFPGGPPGPIPYAPAGGSQGQGGNQGSQGASVVGGGVHHGAAQEGNRSAAFPTHNSGGVLKAVQPHTSTPVLTTGSLPATIPTYDDSSPVKTPAPVGSRAQVEKEAATLAAQAVASKLQEMQLAKEEERRKRKEQKMAERLAAQLTEVAVDEGKKEEEVRTGTGRILDMVEKQEQHKEEAGEEGEKDALKIKDMEGKGGRKKKKERDANSPLLITLKPFYRPNEKNGKRKRAAKEIEVEEPEEDFVPRSPVPLPDGAGLKPVLVKPYLTRMKLPGFNSTEKKSKGVKYADGVLPGQGSPDHGQAAPAPPQPPATPPPKKRYKKAILMVYETHEGDTESDEESPPPPPPGSPPRYRMTQLIEMFGKPRPVAVQS